MVSHRESLCKMQLEDLINLVREWRLALYDPSDRRHRGHDVIAPLWIEVADEVNSTDKCLKYCKIIMTLNLPLLTRH